MRLASENETKCDMRRAGKNQRKCDMKIIIPNTICKFKANIIVGYEDRSVGLCWEHYKNFKVMMKQK